MSPFEIRILDPADIDTHVRQRLDFVREMFLGGDGIDWGGLEGRTRLWMQTHLQDGSYFSYTGLSGRIVVCCAGVLRYSLPPLHGRPNRTVGHILNFYTYRPFRRQGFGTALMEHIKSDAPKRGITRLFLNAAPMGEGLYRKAGFIEAEEDSLMLNLPE